MSDHVLFAVPLRGRVFSSPRGYVCIWGSQEDGPRHPVAGGRRPSPRESGRDGGEWRLPRPSLSRLRFSSVLLFVRFRSVLVPFLFHFCSTFSAFPQVDGKVPREQLFSIERKGKERKKENPKERIPFGIFRTGRMRMFGLTGSRRRWYRLDRPVRPIGASPPRNPGRRDACGAPDDCSGPCDGSPRRERAAVEKNSFGRRLFRLCRFAWSERVPTRIAQNSHNLGTLNYHPSLDRSQGRGD